MTTRTRTAAVEGWFTMDGDEPALLGQRCTTCGSFFFPRASVCCRNPHCPGTEFAEVELSRRGKVWSYTDARYAPPAPYVVAANGHEPFAIAAVELAQEGLVVLGQVVPGVSVDDLAVGMEVELVLDTLFADDDHDYVVWKWKPITSSGEGR